MFGIPEWAIGVAIVVPAVFAGIGVMVRLLPSKPRHVRPDKSLEDQQERFAELERRIGKVEAHQSRIADLEERLDFTERLLVERRDPDRLPPPPS